MGRRSFISMTTINRCISAANRRSRERARDALISTSGGVKELDPEYSITSVDFNPASRMTTVHFEETKHYRTVEKYVTRDYVKYPILSEWKVKTKQLSKSIKLTNDTLEKLNYNSDRLIRKYAFDIIAAIGNEDIFPSWFLKEAYTLEFKEIDQANEDEIQARQKEYNALKAGAEASNKKQEALIRALQPVAKKQKKKIDNTTKKCNKSINRKKSILLTIFTLGIYSYLRSPGRISKLEGKIKRLEGMYSDTLKKIKQHEDRITSNNDSLEVRKEQISLQTKALKEATEKAHKTMLERIDTITPLLRDVEETQLFIPLKSFIGIEYREIKGCYVIRNVENGKCYVGQSKDVLKRLKQHFHGTEAVSRVFVADYYNTGLADPSKLFEVRIIECQTKDELDRLEKELIAEYDSYNKGYNNTKGNK